MPRDLLGVLFVAWCLNWSKKMASSELRGVPNHVQPVTSSWDRLGSKTARATYLGNAKHTKEAAPLLKKHLGSYLYAKQKPYRSLSKDSRSRKKRANSNPQSPSPSQVERFTLSRPRHVRKYACKAKGTPTIWKANIKQCSTGHVRTIA